jgi:phosphoesterase RecJ-like protein
MAEEFFNGGGHLNASGGRINGTMEEAIAIVNQAIKAYDTLLRK